MRRKKTFSKILQRGVKGHRQLIAGARVVSDPEAEGVFQDLETCAALEAEGYFRKKKPKASTKGKTDG